EAKKIYNALKFLEDYDFNSHIEADGKQCNISFYNESGCFTFHSFPQFGDIEIYISNSFNEYLNKRYINNYSINWIAENMLPVWKVDNPNKKYDIIDIVSYYIKKEVEKKGVSFLKTNT